MKKILLLLTLAITMASCVENYYRVTIKDCETGKIVYEETISGIERPNHENIDSRCIIYHKCIQCADTTLILYQAYFRDYREWTDKQLYRSQKPFYISRFEPVKAKVKNK